MMPVDSGLGLDCLSGRLLNHVASYACDPERREGRAVGHAKERQSKPSPRGI